MLAKSWRIWNTSIMLRKVKYFNHFGKVWQFLKKSNIYLPCNPHIFLYTYKGNMSTQDLYINVHSFICNCRKLQTQMSNNRKMDKQSILYPYKEIFLNNRNKILLHASTCMNLSYAGRKNSIHLIISFI